MDLGRFQTRQNSFIKETINNSCEAKKANYHCRREREREKEREFFGWVVGWMKITK